MLTFELLMTQERLHSLTILLAEGIPPAKLTFFQVAMTMCLGRNVSVPTIDSRMSHWARSRISTPN